MAAASSTLSDQTPSSKPEIIVLGPPNVFLKYAKQFSEQFRILKPWESPNIPLEQFLSTHGQKTQVAIRGGSIKANYQNIFKHLPSLRILLSASAGLDLIDLDDCRRNGISVTYAPNIASGDVADLAVGLLLDVSLKISASNRFVKSGLWSVEGKYPLGTKLGGKKVGIVGLGSIGLKVAKRIEAFNCKISYLSRQKKSSISYPFYTNILELASNSDILIICCALNEQTHHLINKEVLLALGKEGIIINIARGAIIDEKALVDCLQEGNIGGAGLDVFENEPHIPKELLELDNVVLSPHVAIFTEESFKDLYEILVRNLDAFFSGKPLITPVSSE